MPDTLRPILEEQPKWQVLSDVLEEIERDAFFNPTIRDDSNSTILIMCSDVGTCSQLREYLQNMHVRPFVKKEDEANGDEDAEKATADFMLRRKLRNYLDWKKDFAKISASLFAENQKALDGYTSVSDQRGTNGYRGKAPPNKRRRVRGGSSAAAAGGGRSVSGTLQLAEEKEAQVASLIAEIRPSEAEKEQPEEIIIEDLDDIDDFYELHDMNDLVVVHPFDGDMDEHVLEEVKPRYVIMYEPDAAFIRRVEVYRSSHDDRNVRVFFLFYGGSVEERRYLSAVRREKDAFSRLIQERAVRDLALRRLTSADGNRTYRSLSPTIDHWMIRKSRFSGRSILVSQEVVASLPQPNHHALSSMFGNSALPSRLSFMAPLSW